MTLMRSAKSLIKSLWKGVLPRHYWQRNFRLLLDADQEAELRVVPFLCDPAKTSVDVGAAGGVFSARFCETSHDVIAFEPRPRQANDLAEMFSHLAFPVRVEAVALSDQVGTAQLRMLANDLGRSTVETTNALEDEDGSARMEVTVSVRKLDDYGLNNVGFIKIDVEGHEVAVLEGARDTITKNNPVLLVEAEDRHRKDAVADVFAFFRALDYAGFFMQDGELHSVDEFDLALHQNKANIGGWKSGWARRGTYINNFFFLPAGRESDLADALEKSA